MTQQIINQEIKILIVDDSAQNLQIIGNLLMAEKYQVVFALSGSEALNLIQKTKFDLILLDIIMPPPDGFEVCKIIKSNPKFQDTPIIFLTAKSDTASIIKGFEAGAQDYVSKPFRSEELLARVRTLIQLMKQREELENLTFALEEKINERTEALKLANQKLVILDKTKNDFLLLISHQLRSPLNVINGFVEILESLANSEEQVRSIHFLKNSAEKLTQLTETALLITEMQLGKYSINTEKISLGQTTFDVLNELKIPTDEGKITVEVTTPINNDTIHGDFRLLTDALKRTIITVVNASSSKSKIQISIHKQSNSLQYKVLNIGTELSKEDISDLANFLKNNESNFLHNENLLSMVVVRLIMDLHSGEMNIENVPETGFVVTLSFPV